MPEEAIILPIEGSKAATIASTDDNDRDGDSPFDERFQDNFDDIDWNRLTIALLQASTYADASKKLDI